MQRRQHRRGPRAQRRGFGDHEGGVVGGAGDVLIIGDALGFVGLLRGAVAQLFFDLQHAQGGDGVFHLLQGGQHGLAIGRHILVIDGPGRTNAALGGAGVEHGLGQAGADGPGVGAGAEQLGQDR